MHTYDKKILGVLITAAALAMVPMVAAQTAPPPGGVTTTPPPTGDGKPTTDGATTPPPTGGTTTPPPTGGTTTPPPTGGTTTPPPTGGTPTPPPTGGTTTPPPTGGTTTPPPTGGTPTPPPTGGTTTPPPTGGTTTPPPTGGTTTPPPTGGTGTPPTGGTTTPPKPCFIPTAGVTPPAGVEICKDLTVPTGGTGTGSTDSSTFFKNVTTDQLGGLGADQLKKFDPTAASGFTNTQIGALTPDAMKGASSDLIKNLTPTAVTGMKDTQIAALQPEAIKGFTSDQMKSLAPSAVSGFNPTQVAQMQPSQLAALQPEQFSKLGTSAVGAVTPDQFKALGTNVIGGMDSSKIAALDVSVIKTLDKESLAKLDITEVKKLDGKELTEMLVNLNKQTVAPADVKSLLPTGWSVDDQTGKVQAPAGTQLTLPSISNTTPTAGIELPKLPDLTKGMTVGGDNSSGSVIDGMKKALDSAGLTGFDMTQTKGVLNVTGTGARLGTKLAFIPDGSEITQAPAGTPAGLKKDNEGKYVLVTPDGVQVPVIPALSSLDNVQKVSPGAKVEVDAEGGTRITQSGKTPVVGIPDPFLKPSTQAPGIYREGSGADEQVTVVYGDGTAQTMKSTVQDPSEFREATKSFPLIREVTIGTDGVIKVNYNGQILQLRADFDVEPGASTAGSATPTITPVNAKTFKFTNSKGDSQEIYLN